MDSGDPYGSIRAHIGKVLAPYFKSVVRDLRRNEHEGDKLVPSVEKGLTDVEVALLHLKQNIEIPDVELAIHPKILAAIESAQSRNAKANVADLGDDINDANFLNALTACVNRWTTDIQKVTKLDRDPESGTSMQEVAFWLNLESALKKIKQQNETEGVRLTIDTLNHAKRFHAVTSFTANTGLKEAMQMAGDYNRFMRDLPLNTLIGATNIEAINDALVQIFGGLRKIRNSKYSVKRIDSFLHAMSRDFLDQFLKVRTCYLFV
jgi:dynein heavy chain 1